MSREPHREDKEKLRLHRWLCDQASKAVDQAKRQMWKIERDRVMGHSGTDTVATKAHDAVESCMTTLKNIDEVVKALREEKKR